MSSAVGSNNKPSPSVAQSVAGIGPDGNLHQLSTDNSGVLNVNSTPAAGSATSANQVLQITQETAINSNTASIDTKTPTVGQKTMANSSPVVIASDQSAVAISAASLPLPTGAATQTTLLAFSNKSAGALVPEAFDYQAITYVGITTDINTVVYKLGGAGGATVATLTMAYDGSNRLSSVTRS